MRPLSSYRPHIEAFRTRIATIIPPPVKTHASRINQSLISRIKNLRRMSMRSILILIVGGVLLLILFAGYTYAIFVSDLATPEKLMNRNNTGIILMDRTGKPFYHTAQAREVKIYPVDSLPEDLKKGIIAIEDENFYTHAGFSPTGIARALLANIRSSSAYSQGASTITQQLVKNALLSPKKSYRRKLQEVLLAFEI